MVFEMAVLLRIKDFKQHRSRIASEIAADLIDLIEHENRCFTGCFKSLNNPPRHRTDIGPAVAAQLGFIAQATDRDPDELPAECSGNRAAK